MNIIADELYLLVDAVQSFLWSYICLSALIFSLIYFSIKTNFVQFKLFKEIFVVFKKNIFTKLANSNQNKNNDKKTTPIQAFLISMAARVGSGNLAGVAVALHLGGAGSIFWMWVITLFGGIIALVENTLAQAYRQNNPEYKESFLGGTAYYILHGLHNKSLAKFFAIISVIYCGFATMFIQTSTVATSWNYTFDIPTYILALFLTAITASLVFGGIRRIIYWLKILFCLMIFLHLSVGIYFLIVHFDQVSYVFSKIFLDAFGINAVGGGFVGVAIITGFKRGLFSTAVGLGDSACASAMSNDTHPINQGLLQVLGTWIDSLVICTMTALIILLSGVDISTTTDIQLLQNAIAKDFGEFGHIFVAILVFLFVYTTLVANYFYSETNLLFLTKNENYLFIYRLLCLTCICCGAFLSPDFLWVCADFMMGVMLLCNLYAIYKLFPRVKFLLDDYLLQIKNGEKNPKWTYKTETLEKIAINK